ncbi:sugar ABC transporter substrate-binding protein [Vibrio sp. M260118]|uniref:sugar ABC transporter substrate-binding protein n=1 Tax=Vibrio sp. M260118 TaxID=3020896 RepID=UPI002F41BD5C
MRTLLALALFLFSLSAYTSDLEIWSGVDFDTIDAARKEVEQQINADIAIRDFSVDSIRSELLIANKNGGALPDAIWIPSDFVGLKQFLGISAIPREWIQQQKMEDKAIELVTVDGDIYAMPLVLGNHLVLYINTDLTSELTLTWEELLKSAKLGENKRLAMQHPTMYFLMAFSSLFNPNMSYATDIDTDTLAKTYTFYELLAESGVVKESCDQYCAMEQFISGKTPYLIDGDWANIELKHHLGSALKVASLPSYNGKHMRSLSGGRVLAITQQAMDDPVKRKQIKQFIDVMQNAEFIQDVIVANTLISAFKELNIEPMSNQSTLATEIYQQLDNAMVMPSSLKMAVMWEVIYRGYKRYKAGMPAQKAAQFTIDFIDREVKKINQTQARP